MFEMYRCIDFWEAAATKESKDKIISIQALSKCVSIDLSPRLMFLLSKELQRDAEADEMFGNRAWTQPALETKSA